MSQADVKIALLIDTDNSPSAKIDVLLSELAKYGVVYIRRAYGNWKSPTLKSWEDVLHECSDFLDRIDKAMLSRLIRGCYEQKIETDSAMIENCFTKTMNKINYL